MAIFNNVGGGYSQKDLDNSYSKGYSAGSSAHGYSVNIVGTTLNLHSGWKELIIIKQYGDNSSSDYWGSGSDFHAIKIHSTGKYWMLNDDDTQFFGCTVEQNKLTITLSNPVSAGYTANTVIQIW